MCVCGEVCGYGEKRECVHIFKVLVLLERTFAIVCVGKSCKKKVKEKTLEAHLQNYLTLDSKKSTKNPKISSA